MSEEKPGSLIDVGDLAGLSEPVKTLFEKVSNGLGGWFAPGHTKRQAKADAEAEIIRASATAEAAKIRAVADIEMEEMKMRAANRFVGQQMRAQANIESITRKAADELPPSTDAENVKKMNEDWVARLLKHCDTVSDENMQKFWAKLLAGEAAAPGSFSKRTVDLVDSLDKVDAQMFTNFCQFVWIERSDVLTSFSLIYDYYNLVYGKKEITFSALDHLDSIGLITHGDYAKRYPSQNVILQYHHNLVQVHPKYEGSTKTYKLFCGHARLSKAGEELYRISGARRNEEFFQYVMDNWKKEKLNPTIVPIHIVNSKNKV